MCHLDAHQPARAFGQRLGERASHREHRVEQRERHGNAHAAQHGAAREMLLGDIHRYLSPAVVSVCWSLLIRKAALLTTPNTNVESLLPSAPASRTMARIAGMS